MSAVQVNCRTVTVNNLKGWPDGIYMFSEDVLNMLSTIGMQKGINLTTEINDLRRIFNGSR